MRTYLIAGFSSIVLGTSVAPGDTLILLNNARAIQEDAPEKVALVEYSTGMYVRTEFGANMLLDIDEKTGNGRWHMDPGFDLGVSFGYRFTKMIGVEVQSGLAWNAFHDYTQGVKPPANAGGNLYQVPIVANFVLTLPLSEGDYEPLFGRGAELLFLAGAGGEWGNATADFLGSQVFTLNDWTWRAQAGMALNGYLTTTTKFGIYFRYSRVGDFTGHTPSGSDYKFGGLDNFAVGLDVSFRF